MVLLQFLSEETIYLCLSLLITLMNIDQSKARDVLPQKEIYFPDYSVYRNLSSINAEVVKIVNNNPSYIRFLKQYNSKNGKTQNVIHVTNFKKHGVSDNKKVNILFSFGEHAREFFPVESVLHLIQQLVSAGGNLKDNLTYIGADILDFIDLYIIVITNPDGRQYVEQSGNYCWRGTSNGVDINRNFAWEFGGRGSSGNKKDEEYRGSHAFSEPESHVYRELTKSVEFDAFISFHSGIRQIYIPYADTKSKRLKREPENLAEMLFLAKVLSTVTGKTYRYGKAADLNDYTADGTVFDYMAGVRKIPFSYAVELWGPDNHKGASCFDLFNPPNTDLKSALAEVNKIYPAFFKYLIDWKRRKSKQLQHNITNVTSDKGSFYISSGDHELSIDPHEGLPPTAPGLLLLVVLIVICLLFYIHGGKFPVLRRMYSRRRIVSLRSLGSSFSSLNMFSP